MVSNSTKIFKHYILLSQGLAKDGRGRGSWTQKSVAFGRDQSAPAGTWSWLLVVGGGIQTVFTRCSRGRLVVGAPPRGAVLAPLSTP